ILIFAARKLFFVIIPLFIAALASILVAPIKWGKLLFQPPRFTNQKQFGHQSEMKSQEVENRFKNLYSSLSAWGQFNEDEMVKDNQDGRKGPACFARKALTLDTSSITEHVLDSVLEGYQQSENKANFFDEDGRYQAILDGVDGYYKEYNCLEPGN